MLPNHPRQITLGLGGPSALTELKEELLVFGAETSIQNQRLSMVTWQEFTPNGSICIRNRWSKWLGGRLRMKLKALRTCCYLLHDMYFGLVYCMGCGICGRTAGLVTGRRSISTASVQTTLGRSNESTISTLSTKRPVCYTSNLI